VVVLRLRQQSGITDNNLKKWREERDDDPKLYCGGLHTKNAHQFVLRKIKKCLQTDTFDKTGQERF
jgi:hypothetical protein